MYATIYLVDARLSPFDNLTTHNRFLGEGEVGTRVCKFLISAQEFTGEK